MVEIINVLNWDLALGTLAAHTAILSSDSPINTSNARGFRVTKINWIARFSSKTANEGPILFGFSTQAVANIKLALEARPNGILDLSSAQAKLPVWPVGQLSFGATSSAPDNGFLEWSETMLNWSVKEGEFLELFALNQHESVALTTGTFLSLSAKIFGVWLND